MNEKINELMLEATEDMPKTYYWPGQYVEKFAELIVAECIALVKPTSHHEVWAQSYLGGVDGLDLLHSKIKDIKEHFGVEE